jgi:hypothetical protein
VCTHIAKLGSPIQKAVRDRPIIPEDSGWQFLCDGGEEETEAQVWALSEVIELEPTLAEFIDAPDGTVLVRDAKTNTWRTR